MAVAGEVSSGPSPCTRWLQASLCSSTAPEAAGEASPRGRPGRNPHGRQPLHWLPHVCPLTRWVSLLSLKVFRGSAAHHSSFCSSARGGGRASTAAGRVRQLCHVKQPFQVARIRASCAEASARHGQPQPDDSELATVAHRTATAAGRARYCSSPVLDALQPTQPSTRPRYHTIYGPWCHTIYGPWCHSAPVSVSMRPWLMVISGMYCGKRMGGTGHCLVRPVPATARPLRT